jgi:hypothetical protein
MLPFHSAVSAQCSVMCHIDRHLGLHGLGYRTESQSQKSNSIYLLLKTAGDKPDDKDDSSALRYKTSSSNATGVFCYL